jgi:hypothetical protein
MRKRGDSGGETGVFTGFAKADGAPLTGLAELTRILLEMGAEVNEQHGRYGNALQAVSYGGHEKIVELLLSKGADVNATARFQQNL